MIPEGWQSVPLADIAKSKIVYGIVQAGPHDPTGVPYLKSSDIGGQIDCSSLQQTAPEIHQRFGRSTVVPGDIVISLRGNIGDTSIVPDELAEANLTQGTARISVAEDFDRDFVFFQLASFDVQRRIHSVTKGSTFVEITLEDLRKIEIPVPQCRRQQRYIADLFLDWNRAIETVEALIANVRAQKQALMQQLLPQGTTPPKKRLPGFSGEWREAEFNEVFDLKIGGTPARKNPAYWDDGKATQNRWVAISDLQGKYIDETQEHISDEGVQNSNVKALASGTVIFSFKLSIGRKAILRKSAFTNEAICALIPKRPEELSSLFVFHALELIDFTASTDQAVKGATLNKAKIADLYLSFPPRAEQDRLVEVLEDADSEIANLQSQLSALRQEKAALMQQLLTGKRRVKLPESEVTHA